MAILNRVQLFAAPLLMVGFVLIELTPGAGWGVTGQLVVVSVLGQVVLGGFIFLAYLVLRRFVWSDSWWVIMPILGLGATLRALSLVWGLELFGLPDEVSWITRLINSLLLIPVTFGLALRGMQYLQEYRERRDSFITLLIEADQQLNRQVMPFDDAPELSESVGERDLLEVNERLAQSLTAVKAALREGADQGDAIGAVREQADSQWRALSHKLRESTPISIPKISFKEFLDTVAQSRPLSLVFLAVGAGFLFALALVRIFPVAGALMWTAAWFAAMALFSLALNEIPRRTARPGLVFSILFVPYAFAGAIFLVIPGVTAGSGLGAAGIHFTVAVSMVLIGMGPAISRSQDSVLSSLRSQLDARSMRRLQVESQRSIMTQKFAERLHSQVRGTFHAGMMRLQQCIDEGRLLDAEREVDLLVDALREQPLPLDSATSFQELHDFLRHWDGLVDISSNLQEGAVPLELVDSVATIVINAVNDAVRHGNARSVDVTFDTVDGEPRLVVTNDGDVSASAGPDGLGNATLDRIAPGQWQRDVTPDGLTELRVSFALRGQP